MFNVLGQLMGIPSLKYSGSSSSNATIEGIGMCIPINSAKPLIEQVLTEGLTEGHKTTESSEGNGTSTASTGDQPRLGVTVTTINAYNNEAVYAGQLPVGALIGEVESGSPAETAGLKADDVVVEVDGTVITSTRELSAQLTGKKAGDTLNVKVYRIEDAETMTGEYVDVTVTLTDFH